MNDMNPSHTRLHSGEWEAALKREKKSGWPIEYFVIQ
jgi:hypothetical protein